MKESDRFKLYIDSYNYSILEVTYVEGNTAWLVDSNRTSNYKYDIRKEKLFKFNKEYQSWDNLDSSCLSPYDVSAVWEERKKPLSNDYSEWYGD